MSQPQPSLRDLLRGATHILTEAQVPSPRVDAELLAAHLLATTRTGLLLLDQAPADFAADYSELVARRAAREPLQHLVGSTGFRYLDLAVAAGVFVPRPETESVVGFGIDWVRAEPLSSPVLVDLCCGAGPIALSLAHEVPQAQVYAVDASENAVVLSQKNAQRNHLSNVKISLGDIRDDDVLSALNATVDLVVTNPPYIPPDQVPLEPEVRDYDPDLALYGGGLDGLVLPRAAIICAARLLRPGGLVVLEHAQGQGPGVRQVLEEHGFGRVQTHEDLTGRPRYSTGFAPVAVS